jgi:carbamoyl-phosphate synthase small subunit
MSKKAILVLEDGVIFPGFSFGAENTACGEVVFDTAMTGYQEMLTDPSFSGQIVAPTYPLIGNYGINDIDFESDRIQVSGFVVREYCDEPSHRLSQKTLNQYLSQNGIPGIYYVDTRALTRHIRARGTMMGIITSELTSEESLIRLHTEKRYDSTDFIKAVTTMETYQVSVSNASEPEAPHIVVVDMGLRYNISRILCKLGSRVTVVPVHLQSREILELKPDGILLSPGPGDPALLDYAIKLTSEIIHKKPVMGICLGHQLIALAMGAKTYKLKFGHRGANHPVKDLATGRIHITMQNHGYAVDANTVRDGLIVSHINVNDGSVEGLRHKELPLISIQFHSEGAPGPQDNTYLFEEFLDLTKKGKT